jgi:hypothetical protein
LAQGATGGDADAPTEATSDVTTPRDRFADRQVAFAEALAEELDLPVDQVADAVTAVRERLHEQRMEARRGVLQERLDEAVASGDLTQEQADAIAEASDAGVLPCRRGFGARRHGHGAHGWFGAPGGGAPGGGAAYDGQADAVAPGASAQDSA